MAPLSSYSRAQHSRWANIVRLCVVWLVFASGAVAADDGIGSQTYTFDIPSQSADSALTEFAEQADLTLVFPDDLVRDRTANALIGEYSLEEGAAILLEGTGLIPSFSNPIVLNITIDETSSSGERAMNATKKAGLVAIIAGALSGGVEAQESTVTETENKTSVVTGTVTDARTGRNLRGAKVTIEETGQWTSTGDLGRFRFSSVPEGEYTLAVSFLGYAGQSTVIAVEEGLSVAESFALRGGTEIEEIVVFGTRSARAIALNQERTAVNSMTVLSSDHLGQFNGTTISEALRRAPGIAFIPDEVTGEGSNVIVRGMEPDLNQVIFNGQRFLDGSGLGRAPNLSNILTESIDRVTINKSLLPSQDTNGAGAVIEIETKGPLDRDRRFARFGVEYGETGSDFGDELGVNGTLSGRFGPDDDSGASLSISYREREGTRLGYGAFANKAVLPLDDNGDPIVSDRLIDPRTSFPFEQGGDRMLASGVGYNSSTSEIENLLANISLQKMIGRHTDARLDIDFAREVRSEYNAATRVQTRPQSVLAVFPDLPNAERYGFVDGNDNGEVMGSVVRSSTLLPDQESQNIAANFRGNTLVNKWNLDYSLGYTISSQDRPKGLEVVLLGGAFEQEGFQQILATADSGLLAESALSNVTSDGRIISVFDPITGDDNRFVSPLFSPEGFAFYNSIDGLQFDQLRLLPARESEGEAINASFDIRRDFELATLRYIAIGVNYQDTTFSSLVSPDQPAVFLGPGDGVTPSSIGLSFGPGLLDRVGAPGDLYGFERVSIESTLRSIDELVDNNTLVERNVIAIGDETRTETTERTLAAYFEGQLIFDKLEITGGLRVEAIEVGSTSFFSPSVVDENGQFRPEMREFGELATESVDQFDVLPRLLANYRVSEDMLFRGGYYRTVARPQLQNLTQRRALFLALPPFFSSTGDRAALFIFQGNPDLEPAVTDNFSLDWEWYFGDIGVLKLATFYKVTKNPLQNNVTVGGLELLPEDLVIPDIPFFNDLPDPLEVNVTQPVNDPDDNTILGVEIAGERQLTFLPGLWNGLGIYANYTYTDSETETELTFFNPNNGFAEEEVSLVVPFNDAPEHQGTIGLTYNKHGIDASLLYTRQARRFESIRSGFGLSRYNESIETLDLRVEYLFPVNNSTVRLFLRGEDLLRSDDEPFLQTSIGGEGATPTYFTGANFYGGRSFFAGASVTF